MFDRIVAIPKADKSTDLLPGCVTYRPRLYCQIVSSDWSRPPHLIPGGRYGIDCGLLRRAYGSGALREGVTARQAVEPAPQPVGRPRLQKIHCRTVDKLNQRLPIEDDERLRQCVEYRLAGQRFIHH